MTVHHRNPLRYAHLFRGADPNRLPNLYVIPMRFHRVVTGMWNTWSAAHPEATAADVLRFVFEMDEVIAPFLNVIP